MVDAVKLFAYNDILVVSELGSGISRGCMNYGRLYQGKYIPPDRTDGLLSQCEDKENTEGENCIEKESQDVKDSAADIDLDWAWWMLEKYDYETEGSDHYDYPPYWMY